MKLYHYTCSHGRDAIGPVGLLRPNYHFLLERRLLWLTDLAVLPSRESVGLTMGMIECDRTEHRYEVVEPGAVWWPVYSASIGLSEQDRHNLEDFGMPAHWFVSERPLRAVAA